MKRLIFPFITIGAATIGVGINFKSIIIGVVGFVILVFGLYNFKETSK